MPWRNISIAERRTTNTTYFCHTTWFAINWWDGDSGVITMRALLAKAHDLILFKHTLEEHDHYS